MSMPLHPSVCATDLVPVLRGSGVSDAERTTAPHHCAAEGRGGEGIGGKE